MAKVEVEKVKKVRKKKLALTYVEPNDNFVSIALGVINEEKAYNASVKTPALITGYNVNDLDNIRRVIIAHYATQQDTNFYFADFSSDSKEFGSNTKKMFTNFASNEESIRLLLNAFLADSSSQKVLFINNGLKLIEDDELAGLVTKALEYSTAAGTPVYIQSHGSFLTSGKPEVQATVFNSMNTVFMMGNLFDKELRAIFGPDKARVIKHLDKAQDAVYIKSEQPIVFQVYKLPAIWFKERTKTVAK